MSLTSVNKATFRLAGSGEEINITDPDFWDKVLGPARTQKMMDALNSGEVLSCLSLSLSLSNTHTAVDAAVQAARFSP
jgi:hypothetical protein